MSEDSKTPELFSGPDPAELDPESNLFSGQTVSHHSQKKHVPQHTPLTIVQSGNTNGRVGEATPIPSELGRFHHIEVVKSGGFGVVCRAEDSQAGRVVALKFPRAEKLRDPSDLKMFVDEANRAMELDHPGIVKTYAVEESSGLLAIVQQFIDGSDLRAEQATLTNHQLIANLVAKIADALSYAHRRGIYHRDLKPANILLDKQGNPYITDFGLAMHEREQLFLPKQRCGTPHYMPPEQVAGLTRRLDGRSDIWSLGVILYELLTKRRPFQGNNDQEIYDQIEHNDPRPPRQIDPTIDRELQRICLKCLERQQRDRYPTADDLAEDLRHWIANPTPSRTVDGQKFISRGFRPFTADDAEFFVELLPGARDRSGVPLSLKFWLKRILLPISVDFLTPLGVIFGPSGSGKSSFVRAGLLPLLSSEIISVVVDCSLEDTEAKLLRMLVERLSDAPEGIGLVDLCAGIGQGLWLPKAKSKVLIVLDQLEQRLSRGDDFQNSDLVRALRFCDGRSLQALVLCRDDFLTHLTRFTYGLGFDLREGENAQAIDLFERKHARRILVKYGQAFGQLPDDAELTPAHEEFFRVVFSELATADYVVCVRLVMFAELFRGRPWTLTELQEVGGVAGVGEKFLEATFGSESRDKRLRSQAPLAQRILAALLPPMGADIRSGSKLKSELQTICGASTSAQVFEETLKSLDGQLKLISPGETGASSIGSGTDDLPTIAYQLTHDSLIESIRGWLDRQLGRTRQGRAQLRLRELGAQVRPGRDPRYLPTHAEWLSWQWLLRKSPRSPGEQAVWAAGRRRLLRHVGLGSVALLAVALVIGWLVSDSARQRREERVAQAIDNLLQDQFSAVPAALTQLDAESELALPRLLTIYEAQPNGSAARLRAALGIAADHPSAREALIAAAISPESTPDQLQVIVQRLGQTNGVSSASWSAVYADSKEDPRRRLRAFVAEVCTEPTSNRWADHGPALVGALVAEPISMVPQWLTILAPASSELLPHFRELFASAHPATDLSALALGIVSMSPTRSSAIEYFLDQAHRWKTPQFKAATSAMAALGLANDLNTLARERWTGEADPWRLVTLSLAMANAGHRDPLVQLYGRSPSDPARILAVHAAVPGRLNLSVLREIYREQRLELWENHDLRRSVLLAFCQQASSVVDATVRDWLDDVALHHVVNDPDAGCFSAAELLMRRLGHDPRVSGRPQRRAKSDPDGRLGHVLIDRNGLAFSIIPDPSNPDGSLAVCTTELTYQEILDFVSARSELVAKYGTPRPSLDGLPVETAALNFLPFEHGRPETDLSLVLEYCNWLTDDNGLGASERSYPAGWKPSEVPKIVVDPQRKGFRLLTSPEWQHANRSSDAPLNLRSPDGAVMLDFAWSFENSRTSDRSVASLLPNAEGLFDMYGNLEEICHASQAASPNAAGYFTHGNTRRSQITAFSNSPAGIGAEPLSSVDIYTTYVGFRIARPLPNVSPTHTE
ncbi:MAG: protein kinase [Planctomycetaceae bacterium]|nr:protein kinase [Planctomycetaceae bacterium]